MADTENNSKKDWEKFDEVSLHKISVVNEESPGSSNDNVLSDSSPPTINNSKESEVKGNPLEIDPQLPIFQNEEKKQARQSNILDPSILGKEVLRPSQPSVISAPANVNGKVLATVYPDNMLCDWVTPPNYDAYSMPSILAIDVPALPGEDYISAIESIIKDTRFKLFATVYSRIIAIWMTFWIVSLAVTLLLQTQGGWPVMIWCLIWAFLLFAGIYACAMIRKRIRIGLNKCVEQANKIISGRHFLIGVEDKGQLSCHKVVIHFVRFNVAECAADVVKLLKIKSSGGCVFGNNSQSEMSTDDIEKEASRLVLRYSQEYVKSIVKQRLIFPSKPIHGVSNYVPKHCRTQLCLCQFIDDKRFNAKNKKWYERYV